MNGAKFDLITVLFLSGVINGLFLSFLLINKKPESVPKKILTLIILLMSYDLSIYIYIYNKVYLIFPHLIGTNLWIPFIYSPLVYLYTCYMASGKSLAVKKSWMIFLPTILLFIYSLKFIFLPGVEKIHFFLTARERENIFINIFSVFMYLQWIVFSVLSFRVIIHFNKRIKNSFSYEEKINLTWLLKLNISFLIIWCIAFALYLVELLGLVRAGFSSANAYFIYILTTIFIYSLGYMGLKHNSPVLDPIQFKAMDGLDNLQISIKENPTVKEKYRKSGLKDEAATEYLSELIRFMDLGKPYLNSSLSLSDLSEIINISPNYLSEIINKKLGKNFFDFINGYRVREVESRLCNTQYNNLTILAIALDCGFSSKTSFNSIFKKHTGKTPSEFRKSPKIL